ncbi:MAG TPA: M12 family metallo-peptidase [Chitinophagaceae bacterium]|nr:MAG: proprotein convertase p [Bacteroidetes bacterium OLB11]HMN33289.1 M12 family metallo-peptidase [Chitinophagaceae bacterium]
MKKILFLLPFMALPFNGFSDSKNFWQNSDERKITVPGPQIIEPQKYILSKLNTSEFKLMQLSIPTEESGQSIVMSLPSPDGSMINFKVFECPMMEKPLADKYPDIKTYTAISVDNPHITGKLDFTNYGFHAIIFNGEYTYFIDPYKDIPSDWYMVYYKNDFQKPLNDRMQCHFENENELLPTQSAMPLTYTGIPNNETGNKQNGTNKRTYRLALACTQEYSVAVAGANPTKPNVLSKMVTTMNRVNGVFEKDLSMHANLVANNDTLIFLTNDPYTNNNGGVMLGQNQTTVTSRIGSANYDYGHVFSTGGGGIASLGCVCSNSYKAQGVTGSSNPVGDPFDIDYVAHEMGHQFGANHTFNSVSGSCSGNRNSSTAYEIGSASTIMGYAGICSTDDIQSHSDAYYHLISLEEMTNNNVMACASNTPSNNTLPTLAPIAQTYTIPYRTAFELTAVGTDGNNNPLTYCWEEYDKSNSGAAWDATTTTGPILRSFYPTTSGTRVFPTLKYLVQNIESYKGERLPDNQRSLKFKCTLRDLNNGYGAFYTSPDVLQLDVKTTASLFRVTSQNTAGQTFNGNSPLTVTWDVAGTNAAPFNTDKVDILFSNDSAKTFQYVIATGVPNNGSYTGVYPNENATWGRIKVKASGNVYFDLNDKWIAVKKINYPAGIQDANKMEFNIYPNPTNGDIIYINFENNYEVNKLEIISNTGQVVKSHDVKSGDPIQLQNIAKGVYVAKLISNGKTKVKKLIIQ